MNHTIDYAKSFVGIPYGWGGSHPAKSLDCSGLVQIILKSTGEDPPGDQSAQALYNHFSDSTNGIMNRYAPGSLAFYGKDAGSIIHVGFVISAFQMIEAGGGGSDCLTLDDAIKKEAFVRMSLIKSRKDFICVIRPRYSKIGMI